ncbi:MAG: TIGR00730 family Rossman fold protein, partial [Flavobacterium sp.]
MNKLKAVCVYCGSNFNGDVQLRKAIKQLAETLVKQGIRLVYGGGSVGVMGVLANDILEMGGLVTGVIPQFLMDKEVGHKGVTEMIIT